MQQWKYPPEAQIILAISSQTRFPEPEFLFSLPARARNIRWRMDFFMVSPRLERPHFSSRYPRGGDGLRPLPGQFGSHLIIILPSIPNSAIGV
jgi:hypothetical protein